MEDCEAFSWRPTFISRAGLDVPASCYFHNTQASAFLDRKTPIFRQSRFSCYIKASSAKFIMAPRKSSSILQKSRRGRTQHSPPTNQGSPFSYVWNELKPDKMCSDPGIQGVLDSRNEKEFPSKPDGPFGECRSWPKGYMDVMKVSDCEGKGRDSKKTGNVGGCCYRQGKKLKVDTCKQMCAALPKGSCVAFTWRRGEGTRPPLCYFHDSSATRMGVARGGVEVKRSSFSCFVKQEKTDKDKKDTDEGELADKKKSEEKEDDKVSSFLETTGITGKAHALLPSTSKKELKVLQKGKKSNIKSTASKRKEPKKIVHALHFFKKHKKKRGHEDRISSAQTTAHGKQSGSVQGNHTGSDDERGGNYGEIMVTKTTIVRDRYGNWLVLTISFMSHPQKKSKISSPRSSFSTSILGRARLCQSRLAQGIS